MAASLSRTRAAGAALAVLFALTAASSLTGCGGGGGGGDTNPPPPPPVDTTPPTVKSWTPADGAKDVDTDGTVTLSVTLDEAIGCPNLNPITITKGNGEEVKGGTYSCTSPILSLAFEAKALFRCETYTVTLPKGSVKDVAGNALANDSKVTVQTKCPAKVAMIVTANAGTSADPRYTSVVNTETGEVSHAMFPGAPLGTRGVAVDNENHQAYYTATISGGCAYSMDLETHTVSCIKVNPEGSSYGRSAAVTVADQGVYFATSSESSDQPGNLVLVFDRSNRSKLATVTLPDAAYSPTFMIADRGHNRVYVLSYDKSSLVFNPWPDYLPGFVGKVYEIDTTTNTLTKRESINVCSAPVGAVVDAVNQRLYVSCWGDRAISIINLASWTARTVDLPSFFAEDDKYFQRPVGLALVGTKLLIANSKFSKGSPTDQVGGLAVLDLASEKVTQTIPVGDIPLYMVSVGDDVWVTTGNTESKQYFVVRVSTVTFAVLGSIAVGPSPVGIAAYTP